jgi:hypothetical protein
MTDPTLTSAVPRVIDYLFTAAVASPLLGASPTAPVTVLDGPTVGTDTLADLLHLWIGHEDPRSYEASAAGAIQRWKPMDHGRTRDEDGEIWCTADAWTGSVVMKAARDQCAAIVGGVELLLRGLPQDGGPGDLTMGGLVYWSAVDGPFSWAQRQEQQGAGCQCTFRVTYRARLTTAS